MRLVLAIGTAILLTLSIAGIAQQKTPPAKVLFKTKMGNVTYDHAKHLERAKNDCKVCHDKLFPQAQAPLTEWKAGMHRAAEKAKTACGACHNPGGPGFAATVTANCAKCHVKG